MKTDLSVCAGENEMSKLTKDAILKAEDLPTEKVPVPEWGPGQSVTVRTMSGDERDRYEQDAD